MAKVGFRGTTRRISAHEHPVFDADPYADDILWDAGTTIYDASRLAATWHYIGDPENNSNTIKPLVRVFPAAKTILGPLPTFLGALYTPSMRQHYSTFFPLTIVCINLARLEKVDGASTDKDRYGWYRPDMRLICLATRGPNPVKTLAHELGHWADTKMYMQEANRVIAKYERRAVSTADRLVDLI